MATLIAAGLVAAILRKAIAIDWNEDVRHPSTALALDALVVLAALTFYPFIKAYSLGQIQMWLNVLFGIVVLAWMMGAPGAAGAALGLMCLVKPTYAFVPLGRPPARVAIRGGRRRGHRRRACGVTLAIRAFTII